MCALRTRDAHVPVNSHADRLRCAVGGHFHGPQDRYRSVVIGQSPLHERPALICLEPTPGLDKKTGGLAKP